MFQANYYKGTRNEAEPEYLALAFCFLSEHQMASFCAWSFPGLLSGMKKLAYRQLSDLSQFLSLPMGCMFLSVSRVKFVSLTVNLETAFHRLDGLVTHALTPLIHLNLACWICK